MQSELNPKLLAAIAAAINAYIEQEAAGARAARPGRWVCDGRLRATRAHQAWAGRRGWRR